MFSTDTIFCHPIFATQKKNECSLSACDPNADNRIS